MTLLETWRKMAYETEMNQQQANQFWGTYFNLEKGIYEQILANPDEIVKGTVADLAKKYDVELMIMVGFLDGINDSLKNPNPIEEMEADTVVSLDYDKEKLYYNMWKADAPHLYSLDPWDTLFTPEKKKEIIREFKKSKIYHAPIKIGRNEPCPCGSGKKYKNCCGKN